MNKAKIILRLYYLPLSFPCGPRSSCCGPVGQSEEELQQYVAELKAHVPGVDVQTVNVTERLDPRREEAVLKLLNSFGGVACPIFALDGEVLSIGPPLMSELIDMLKGRLPAQA